jgi:hypothetical protein
MKEKIKSIMELYQKLDLFFHPEKTKYFKFKFSLIIENKQISHEELYLEDLIQLTELTERINTITCLGAVVYQYSYIGRRGEEFDKFDTNKEIFSRENGYLYTSNGLKKYQRIKIYFFATEKILRKKNFIKLIEDGEIKELYIIKRGIEIKISLKKPYNYNINNLYVPKEN